MLFPVKKKPSMPVIPADDPDQAPEVTAADIGRGVWRRAFRPVAYGPDAPESLKVKPAPKKPARSSMLVRHAPRKRA